ncbi:flavin reductase family protein [Bradyrhizobium jicamae]|uniref:flavin reductase family protein n=1 Tax=Bradyrhizobium jicamae TaxID=280332 RepID=UPI001BA6ECF7|nr:flavin reductase family protein [Bradyrhizobium jicamae]
MSKTPDEDVVVQTKLAMRRLASSVAIVTCQDESGRYAMTATSLSAMSMRPPSLIVCVNRSSSFYEHIRGVDNFGVNILNSGQADVSMRCGTSGQMDRFGAGSWRQDDSVPILADAQASLICESADRFDYGSHSIFVGRVLSVVLNGTVDPLIYLDGTYEARADRRQNHEKCACDRHHTV